ncbi:hypothetical protein SK128_000954 [Halocaridina rubra]|uniref:Protein DEK n=1 Tax=Halocaridina rubra TaxID=373956 RepID=A0AAN9A9N7_HALRR
MSEDEVKPQSEEPTPDAVKKEEVKENVEKEKKETNGEKEEVEENDQEEEEEEEEEEKEVKEEDAEDMKDDAKGEEEEEEKPRPKVGRKKKVVSEAPETSDKNTVPLYDQPLELSGKRDRKKVERFIQEEKKEELKFDGRGSALSEIPFIDAMITNTHHDDLKLLHRIAFNRPGKGPEIKKNLRQFNGFTFTKDDKKFELKMSNVERIVMPEIKRILNILGLEKSGHKREVVERLMDFMVNPKDTGKKPPKVKKPKGRGRPKKGEEKSKTESAAESDSDESSSPSEDDSVAEKPKKTPAKKTPAKKAAAKKTPARKTPSAAKKAPTKRAASARKEERSSESDEDSDSESDDEPLSKKVKQPPTDNEIKVMVKKILDGANLEEVTMKSVCRQVYESYPDFDLTHKKDFIKETVKSIIS